MSKPPLYELENVQKTYGGRRVLQIGQFQIFGGEILGLVGPTGAGKSTLLRLLSGVEPPSAGRLQFGEFQLGGQPLPPTVQRRITMVFQRPLLMTGTVRSNVEYGLRLRGMHRCSSKVRSILDALRLNELAHRSALTLSGGQTQLVALARALVIEPEVLLLDEPTANLDPAHVALVEETILQIQRRQCTTIVWATHNIFQARRTAQRVALLLDGQLAEVAPTETFFESPADPRTEAFVHGKMIY
jgi:tungstate transport system ATP-binding protein